MTYLLVMLGVIVGMIAAFFAGDRYRKKEQDRKKAIDDAHKKGVAKDAEKINDSLGNLPMDIARIRETTEWARRINRSDNDS